MQAKVMQAKDFKGIIPPLMTLFDSDGNVNKAQFKNYINWIVPNVQAIYPLGTYGCGPFMTNEERKEAAEIIVNTVNGRIPVIIHVGAVDTKSAVELAKHAEAIGANAVGAIAPYYTPLKEEELYGYFRTIMDAIHIPMFLYNNPQVSKQTVSPELIKRLAEVGLRGIKDSSFDIVSYYNYVRAVKEYDDFNVIIGTEALITAAFQMGATAAVTGLGNIFPELLQDLYRAVINNETKKANDLQLKVLRLREITKYGQTVPTMQAILKLRGVDCGVPRAPYRELNTEVVKKVEKALKELNML